MSGDVHVELLEGGRIARIELDAGRGNVLDRRAIAALSAAFREAAARPTTCAMLLTHRGPDFSFGASVAEHAPGAAEQMLPEFHDLFRTFADTRLPCVAAVRGRCLGGGLELALAAQHVVAATDASLGLPEVTLGVFPPVAAVLLPFRVRQPVADRLVSRGELIDGETAFALGVVDEVVPAADVEERARAFAHPWTRLSAVAVRHATRAARYAWNEALQGHLGALETQYLRELMTTRDAKEGITAFLARRTPTWEDQ